MTTEMKKDGETQVKTGDKLDLHNPKGMRARNNNSIQNSGITYICMS